jgi:ATP-dependent DNA ligase
VKNLREGTFWVVGYAPSPGRRIGSLVIAEKDEDSFRVVARVSSGIDERFEGMLLERVRSAKTISHSPSTTVNVGASVKTKDVTWVTPFFGVETSFTEKTRTDFYVIRF